MITQRREVSGCKRFLLSVSGLLLIAVVWQLAAIRVANPGLVPSLNAVALATMRWFKSGALARDCLESLPRAWLALAIATPLGIGLGLTLALSRTAHGLFDAAMQFVRSLPPVALLPLFILWFGIDWNAKLWTAIFVCVFPVAVTASQAGRAIDAIYRELAIDLRLSQRHYLTTIVLPGTLPSIIPGIRLAAGTSFIMVFVSEIAGASLGLGYRISIAQLAYQADLMLAALALLGFAGFCTDWAIVQLSRRMLHYAAG